MRFNVLVCDLDDTLIGEDRVMSRAVKEAVDRLRCKGGLFTIATGRIYSSACRYARQLEVDQPLITNGGALIKEPDNGDTVWQATLEPALSERLLRKTERAGALRYFHLNGEVYADKKCPENDYYEELLGVDFRYRNSLDEALSEGEPTGMIFRFPKDELKQAEAFHQQLQSDYGADLSVVRSLPHLVEVLPAEASKGRALVHLTDHLQVELSQVVAVGDSDGDLSMITKAGLGVAVAGAPQHIKRGADFVTEGGAGEGVVELIDLMLDDELTRE